MDYNELFDLLNDIITKSSDEIYPYRWLNKVIIAEQELSDLYLGDSITAIWYNKHKDPEPFYFSELKVEVEPNLNWIKVLFEA